MYNVHVFAPSQINFVILYGIRTKILIDSTPDDCTLQMALQGVTVTENADRPENGLEGLAQVWTWTCT